MSLVGMEWDDENDSFIWPDDQAETIWPDDQAETETNVKKSKLPGAAIALVLSSSAALAYEWPDPNKGKTYPDPSDTSVGKPADISRENFATIRPDCAAEWQDNFRMRAYCERRQFDGIRTLRGTN
jgi:hypothetical protein